MTRRGTRLDYGLSLLMLRAASLRVAKPVRAEWLGEWRAELWYARAAHAARRTRAIGLLGFSFGAFRDAQALHGLQRAGRVVSPEVKGSARECLGMLAALLAISLGIGLLLPRVRAHLVPATSHGAPGLVVIGNTDAAEHSVYTLPESQYATWRQRRQRIFQSFAFYAVSAASMRCSAKAAPSAPIRLAHASRNVFELLGLPAAPIPRPATNHGPGLVVSRELWQSCFDQVPARAGNVVWLGSQRFLVQAIASMATAQLPGHPDAWLLAGGTRQEPDQQGFVLGRLNPAFQTASWGDQWQLTAPLPDGSPRDFTCWALAPQLRQPWDLYVFAVLLALVALPATTSLPLGDYPAAPRRVPITARVGRWAFLLGKLVGVLAIVYCTSLDLAFAGPHTAAHATEYVQLLSCFALCLWGLRWALRDQRQRCPVCLGKLTHPARVGHPSRNFLAWNGTELICAGGHGLLHVPEIATSWFGTQRWLYLDASWAGLFPEPAFSLPASRSQP